MNSSALEAMQDFLSSREAVATAQNVFIKGSSMFFLFFFVFFENENGKKFSCLGQRGDGRDSGRE